MAKKKIILIPYWIQAVLTRHQLPMLECLNIEKLKGLCSAQDLAGFIALNNYFEALMGLSACFHDVYWEWTSRLGSAQPELTKFCSNTLLALSYDPAIKEELRERLFTPEARRDQDKESFITYDLTQDVGGIVIYPGFFAPNPNMELQTAFVEGILKLSYVYDSYHEVAKTPAFRKYLELLAA